MGTARSSINRMLLEVGQLWEPGQQQPSLFCQQEDSSGWLKASKLCFSKAWWRRCFSGLWWSWLPILYQTPIKTGSFHFINLLTSFIQLAGCWHLWVHLKLLGEGRADENNLQREVTWSHMEQGSVRSKPRASYSVHMSSDANSFNSCYSSQTNHQNFPGLVFYRMKQDYRL